MNYTDIVSTLWTNSLGGDRSVALSSTYLLFSEDCLTSASAGWTDCLTTETQQYQPWTVTYNPCEPYLSIPAQILTLHPHWQYCLRFFRGLHDPPRILATENGFVPVTTTSHSPKSPAKTNDAMTAQAVQQTMATKTSAPGTEPTPSSLRGPQVVQLPQQNYELPAVITIGQSTITANSKSAFVIGTQTLPPNQQITDSGTVLSMAPDGETLYLGGTSVLLRGGGSKTATATAPGVAGLGAGERVQPNSGRGRRDVDDWIIWKIATCIIGLRLFR